VSSFEPSPDLVAVLRVALDNAVDVLDVDGGWIALDDEREAANERPLPVVSHRGISDRYAAALASLPRGEGVVGLVLKDPHAVVVDDAVPSLLVPSPALREGVRTVLALPLEARDVTLGVLALLSRRRRQFAAADVDFAKAAAAQMAWAIEHAMLLRRQLERAERQRRLLEAAETVNRSLDSLSLEATILAESARLLGAPKSALLVVRGDALAAQEVHGLSERCKQLFVVPLEGSAFGRAVLDGETVAVSDVTVEDADERSAGLKPVAGSAATHGASTGATATPGAEGLTGATATAQRPTDARSGASRAWPARETGVDQAPPATDASAGTPPPCAVELEYRSLLAAPLQSYRGTYGVLALFFDRPRRFDDEDRTLLRTFAVQAAIALDNRRLLREKDQMAVRDGLTGLYNRSYLELSLERTNKELRRNGGSVSILFYDLDGMKQVNDTHGHQAGDQLLRDMAGVLVESCRETDVVARYGGDEFVVLMPGTDAEGAGHVAAKVDEAVARHNETARGPIRLSASMGMHSATEADVDDLLLEADRRMYAMKRARGQGQAEPGTD
jgi:diguanylate cyclase (GGDEF)-like protein